MEPHYQQRLSQQCEVRGLTVSADQQARLLHYLDLLLHSRPSLNLTGLRDAERMLDVLIIESLDFFAGGYLVSGKRVLDLGTGAGVPGLPLAVCCPTLHMTLLDRSTKKIAFLQRVVEALQLPHCQPVCGTSEELAPRLTPHRTFDVVVSRGVGTMAHLMRLTAKLLHPGGLLLLRKPLDTPELHEAEQSCAVGPWRGIERLALPWSTAAPWMVVAVHRRPSR